MAKQITLRQGSMVRKVEVDDNTTVGDIREKFGKRMEVSNNHNAIMSSGGSNPNAVENDALVEDGATLEFSRTTGQKG